MHPKMYHGDGIRARVAVQSFGGRDESAAPEEAGETKSATGASPAKSGHLYAKEG